MWVHSPAMLEKPRGMFGAHWLVDLSVISNDDWPASICFLPTHGKNRSAPRKWPMSHKPPCPCVKPLSALNEWNTHDLSKQLTVRSYLLTCFACMWKKSHSMRMKMLSLFCIGQSSLLLTSRRARSRGNKEPNPWPRKTLKPFPRASSGPLAQCGTQRNVVHYNGATFFLCRCMRAKAKRKCQPVLIFVGTFDRSYDLICVQL